MSADRCKKKIYNSSPAASAGAAAATAAGCLSGGAAPLVNSGSLQADDPDLCRRRRRNERYKLLGLLRDKIWKGKLPSHQARFCSAQPVPDVRRTSAGEEVPTGMPGTVQVHYKSESQSHHYYGLNRCASALVCPVCSVIICARRNDEVVKAGTYMLKNGFKLGMVTQTASHHAKTSLYDFIQRFQAAQRDMKGTREYQAWQKQHGVRYTIRSVEITDDNPDYDYRSNKKRRTGWHFHSHTLLFFERLAHFTNTEIDAFSGEFQTLWLNALAGVGLTGRRERAAYFSVPPGVTEAEGQAALAAYAAKGIGAEVSGGRLKSGRGRDGDRRISSWRLQELALTTRPELISRYADYMYAVKGLNWLRWSQGLKAFCGIDDVSDAELTHGESSELVWDFMHMDFGEVVRQFAQGRILDIADRWGAAGIERAVNEMREGVIIGDDGDET